MKKRLAILLAFMMIMSTVCSMGFVSAAPAAEAPIYEFVVGRTELGLGNVARDQDLFDAEAGFTSGKFPLTVMLDNTTGALGGTFVLTYDPAKVTLKAYKNRNWVDASGADKIWNTSEYSGYAEIGTPAQGFGTEADRGYVYISWAATGGKIDAEAVQAGTAYVDTPAANAEIGCIVFETKEGVTADDFDKNTFKLWEGATNATITAALASGGSPLSFNVKADGGDRYFGVTDDLKTREPMNVKFIYPNADVEPGGQQPSVPGTYTVTFMADGVTVRTITKNVGETLAVADFPAVPEKEGYTGAWDVTTDITGAKTVIAIYTPVVSEGATADGVFTDGIKGFDFETDKTEYDLEATPGYANYVISTAGNADTVKVEYSEDGGAYAEANNGDAYYFELDRGVKKVINVKLTDREGNETVYTYNVTIPACENTLPAVEKSGIEIPDFSSDVREYTITSVDPGEEYVRLWAKADPNDDARTFQYAIGNATDNPEDLVYATNAVGNNMDREDTMFGQTENFDANWREKSFVNLWTDEIQSGTAIFIKVIAEANDEIGYYVIKFQ